VFRLFAASAVVGMAAACGGQVDIGRASGRLNVGGSTDSSSTETAGGSSTASSGGSSGVDWSTYCGGLFFAGCKTEQITDDLRSCDIPLQQSPPDILDVKVAIDCSMINPVNPDAGLSGYYVDYDYSPAHLILTGSVCANMQTYGALGVTVIGPCFGGGP